MKTQLNKAARVAPAAKPAPNGKATPTQPPPKGLPNQHYTDPQTFQTEAKAVLFQSWAGIAFAHDIPNHGDVKPIDFAGIPLLAARDKNKIRVFQNTCRHRGMILVDKPKNIQGAIRCPYHSWCYGLDGRLRATPHIGGAGQNTHPDIARGDLGLWEMPATVYMGVIFVNVAGNAPPFKDANAELLTQWRDFDKPLYHNADSAFNLTLAANWKLAVENYCESYHLPWVHPDLNMVSKLEDHYHIQQPMRYSGQGSVKYSQMRGARGEVFDDFDGLGAQWQTGSEYVALYPNVLLGVHRDHSFAIILEPRGCGQTVEHVALFYASEDAVGGGFAELRARNAGFWKGVFKEDIFVVEGMQKGRAGPLFDGGRFSPVMDGPTQMFHEWVAERMGSYQAQASGA